MFIGTPLISHAEDVVPQADITKYEVPAMVTYYAAEYKVPQDLAHYIARKESGYDPNDLGDLNILCTDKTSPYYKQPVYSRGVYQISRCYYPNVSDVQAFNPEYNVEYAMGIIARGKSTCMSQFSTCRNYYEG